MDAITLDPETTALVLIDLQQAIVGRTLAPHSSADVVTRCRNLAESFRQNGAAVIYVRVDLANFQKPIVDQSMRDPNAPPPQPEASQLVPEAGYQAGDILITKRFWGAFGGTDLEKQLHNHGIKTIVMGGIATNFGVESTARSAAELGFSVVLVENAMSSMSAEMHRFAIEKIFPRMGRVRSAGQMQFASA